MHLLGRDFDGFGDFMLRARGRLMRTFLSEQTLNKKFTKKLAELKMIGNCIGGLTCWEDSAPRYYIHEYIKRNSKYIHGDVMEFVGGEVVYAQKYGLGGGAC